MADQVTLEVPPTLAGERLDKVISEMLGVSRAIAAEIVAAGATIDGESAKSSERLKAGQTIRCESRDAEAPLEPEQVHFEVVFEDEVVVVVDKPAGVIVHPGAGRSTGTLAAGLLNRFPELAGVGQSNRWGLVHRLDKNTSGLLLVARTQASYDDLSGQLKRRAIVRSYVALVEGRPAAPTGTIDAPIGRDPNRPTRRAISHTGKAARTHFQVDSYFAESDCTLMSVGLETGRTHQIRVHLSSIAHPVVGDRVYGASRKDIAVPRTFLHAGRLEFNHPETGELVTVESPLPADLQEALDSVIAKETG